MFIYGDGIGRVELVDHMGTDLTVVNAARVSYGGNKQEVDEKDKKLVKYLFKNHHTCYDDKTEIFTNNGWKLFKDLNLSDKIAAVSPHDFSFTFEYPKNYYNSEYNGIMFCIESHAIDFCVTPNHRMLYSQRTSTGFTSFKIKEIQNIYHRQLRVRTTSWFNNNKGISVEYWLGCLIGFYTGDGFLYSKNIISFRLKRERKVRFLQRVLKKLNIDYKLIYTSNKVYQFKLDRSVLQEYIDVTKKTKDKYIPHKLIFDSSTRMLKGLFTGLMKSDGSTASGNCDVFDTNSIQLSQDFVNICTLLGKRCYISKALCYKKNNIYRNRCMINARTTSRINDSRLGEQNKVKKNSYNGIIYCVESSTGLLLVRRNNKTLVCGNSPFEHCQITFKFTVPLFVRSQHHRHRVWSFNEVSRRYTADNLEFYEPAKWRTQSTDNKQCSENEFVSLEFDSKLREHCQISLDLYNEMVEGGVAREMARMVLPQNLYTSYYGSVNLHNAMHFLKLRLHPHAQWEIQQVALAMKTILADLYPECMKVYEECAS